jgi:putative peptidoglycan lipid II flippase
MGLSADQINSFVDQVCASFLRDGSITALYNSNRVMQLPLALFGIAVASVSLPALSRLISENKEDEFKDTLNFSLRVANFILIPAFAGLAVLGFPIVQALFQHGRFTEAQARLTYYTLVPYALGLPAYSATKILASAFYARKDTKTPARNAIVAMLVNVFLNVILMWKLEAPGLALATTTAAWFQSITLFWILRREMGFLGGRGLIKSFVWSCVAGTLMALLCYILSFHVLAHFSVYIRVFVPIAIGTPTYFLAAKLFKVPEYDFFMRSLLKKKAS